MHSLIHTTVETICRVMTDLPSAPVERQRSRHMRGRCHVRGPDEQEGLRREPAWGLCPVLPDLTQFAIGQSFCPPGTLQLLTSYIESQEEERSRHAPVLWARSWTSRPSLSDEENTYTVSTRAQTPPKPLSQG
jgi:hypothetical protein